MCLSQVYFQAAHLHSFVRLPSLLCLGAHQPSGESPFPFVFFLVRTMNP